MDNNCCMRQTDNGPGPCVLKVEEMAAQNQNFRTAVWTGCHMQMTIMCIPPCEEIGWELHPDTEQMIRVEHGKAIVLMGRCKGQPECQYELCPGDAVFVPAGTWHNIMNPERCPLKLSSVYAPPKHPWGTVHRTKADAERHGNSSSCKW